MENGNPKSTHKVENPAAADVIPTGFCDLDNMVSGLHNSDLILLAGRPGMGTTALALGIAANVAKRDKVLYTSLDLCRDEICKRLYVMQSEEDDYCLIQECDDAVFWEQVLDDPKAVWNKNLIVDDPFDITISELRSSCISCDAKFLVIDYLQLVGNFYEEEANQPDYDRRREEFAFCQDLKRLAEELNLPILVLSKLPRFAVDPETGKPGLSYIRRFTRLDRVADVIAFLYRSDYYDPESPYRGTGEVIVNYASVLLSWQKQHIKFADLSRGELQKVMRKDGRKILILNLLELLLRHTDAEHRLSQEEIADLLRKDYCMTADREAILCGVVTLMEYGFPIDFTETIRMVPRKDEETGEMAINPGPGAPEMEESYLWSDFWLGREDADWELPMDRLLYGEHISYDRNREQIDELEKMLNEGTN